MLIDWISETVFPQVRIEEIAASHPGAIKIGPFGSQLKKEDLSEFGYKVYGQENIIANDFSLGKRRIDRSKFLALKSCRLVPGDLVITMMGTIGKCTIFPDTAEVGIMDSHLLRIQVNTEIADKKFMALVIAAEEVVGRQILQMSHGSIMSGLSSSIVRQLRVPLPPLDEQHHIVEILNTLDETIAHTSSLIAKLKQIKAGLLHDLLTRGLDENGELRDAIAHPEQFKDSPLGQIPKEWEVHTMQELTTKIVDGVHKTPVYVETGVPFLTVENLTAGIGISLKNVRYITLNDHVEYSKRANPKPGDVLVSKDGTLGVARIITDDLPEVSIFVSVAQLRPNENLVLPSFICTFFETREYKRQLGHRSAGTGLKHIHLEHFRAFQLATPSIEEQRLISKVLDTHDTRIRTEETYLNKLKLQKKGLMHDLLTGKVRVNQMKNNLAIPITA